MLNIRIDPDSSVSLREQIASQVKFLIATGELKPGEPLPTVRALGRQLGVHKNTVSLAYKDVRAWSLISSKRGQRITVVDLEERPGTSPPDLDDVINQAIGIARSHGYTLQALSARVRERLLEESPDHVLVLSFDAGMRRILASELAAALKCRIRTCSPNNLAAKPELAFGALVVSPPGVLPAIAGILPRNRQAIPILYSSAEPHLTLVRELNRPSLVAVASVSEGFMSMARGILGPLLGNRHQLIECIVPVDDIPSLPAADLLICDAIVARQPGARNLHPYRLISPECLAQINASL